MSAAPNITTFPSRLESLETEALLHWQKSLEEMQKFLDKVDEIKGSKLWKAKAKTWAEYCEANMPLTDTRIRQFKAALPMQVLAEIITGVTLTEYQARVLKQKINEVVADEDKGLILHVWQLAHEYSGAIEPDKDILKAAYTVVKNEAESGMFEFDDKHYNMRELVHNVGIQKALIEQKEYQKVIIEGNSKKKAILITAQRQGDVWVLRADSELPDSFEFKLWREDDSND